MLKPTLKLKLWEKKKKQENNPYLHRLFSCLVYQLPTDIILVGLLKTSLAVYTVICICLCFSGYENGVHLISHQLEAISAHSQSAHIDTDYTKFTTGDYNYLDSNYMPAF